MAQKSKGEPDFEKILQELEELLEQLENGSLSLDESINKYERAQECLNICRQKLENAELRINKVNGTSLEKFNPDADV